MKAKLIKQPQQPQANAGALPKSATEDKTEDKAAQIRRQWLAERSAQIEAIRVKNQEMRLRWKDIL